MGNFLSGNRRPSKPLVEKYPSVTAQGFLNKGFEIKGYNTLEYIVFVVDLGEPKKFTLPLSAINANYGKRYYLMCPYCGKRYTKLYYKSDYFACRKCHNLQYYLSARSGNPHDEIAFKAEKIAKKLNYTIEYPDILPYGWSKKIPKPPNMRYDTYEGYIMQLMEYQKQWDYLLVCAVIPKGMRA